MANDGLKYFIRQVGSTFSMTQASSSGASKPKAPDGWKGFKTLAEREAWRKKRQK